MNKEQQGLLDDAYEKYADSHWTPPSNPKGKLLSDQLFSVVPMEHSKETFINKCKMDPKFSKKWGLTIEERELSHDERFVIYKKVSGRDLQPHITGINFKQFHFDEYNIPTRLITITYNDKTIESYE
jgi:hypothetical protein